MGILIGITAGLHILVMKGMQLKFEIKNFGELLTRMGYEKTYHCLARSLTRVTGISQARKDNSAHGFLKRSAGICATISFCDK